MDSLPDETLVLISDNLDSTVFVLRYASKRWNLLTTPYYVPNLLGSFVSNGHYNLYYYGLQLGFTRSVVTHLRHDGVECLRIASNTKISSSEYYNIIKAGCIPCIRHIIKLGAGGKNISAIVNLPNDEIDKLVSDGVADYCSADLTKALKNDDIERAKTIFYTMMCDYSNTVMIPIRKLSKRALQFLFDTEVWRPSSVLAHGKYYEDLLDWLISLVPSIDDELILRYIGSCNSSKCVLKLVELMKEKPNVIWVSQGLLWKPEQMSELYDKSSAMGIHLDFNFDTISYLPCESLRFFVSKGIKITSDLCSSDIESAEFLLQMGIPISKRTMGNWISNDAVDCVRLAVESGFQVPDTHVIMAAGLDKFECFKYLLTKTKCPENILLHASGRCFVYLHQKIGLTITPEVVEHMSLVNNNRRYAEHYCVH